MEQTLEEEAVKASLIKFDQKKKYITYIHQNKRRRYENPEEKVQAEAYVRLVIDYGYSPDSIDLIVPVRIGASTAEADIIVYRDSNKNSAHIVVECKREEVSEQEFSRAVSQAFSYAATGTVRAKYFWVTSNIKNSYFQIPDKEPKNYTPIPDVPKEGENRVAPYKYVKGGVSENGQRLFDIEPITEKELTLRLKQAHNALWAGGALNPSVAFDELDKLIFCKIWDEKNTHKQGKPYAFQIFRESTKEKTNKELKKRIENLYEEGRKKDPEVFKESIRLNPEKLRTLVSYLEGIDLSKTDLDSKGRAFETFMGSFFRGDFGQYFTPRPVVRLIVDALPINNNSLVLDTSCGSGGFLLHALDKVRNIAKEIYHDENSKDHYNYWHDFAKDNLFGIEINEQIARTAKMNMIIHDDGHTNVITADGLLPIEEIEATTKNRGFKPNHFDFIITNPPFGSKIKQTEKAYMNNYGFAMKGVDWLNPNSKEGMRESQSTEVLFIEQCYNYLTEGGYLAIVLPDGVLTNSSSQYVRDGIEEMYRILAVISLPQHTFSASGAGVKCSVLFLKKHTQETTKLIKDKKVETQEVVKRESNYPEQLDKLDEIKKENTRRLTKQGLNKDSEAYKKQKNVISENHKKKKKELQEQVMEAYTNRRKAELNSDPIFMAIAEDIGYDATGRPTKNNDLTKISEELQKFIEDEG